MLTGWGWRCRAVDDLGTSQGGTCAGTANPPSSARPTPPTAESSSRLACQCLHPSLCPARAPPTAAAAASEPSRATSKRGGLRPSSTPSDSCPVQPASVPHRGAARRRPACSFRNPTLETQQTSRLPECSVPFSQTKPCPHPFIAALRPPILLGPPPLSCVVSAWATRSEPDACPTYVLAHAYSSPRTTAAA